MNQIIKLGIGLAVAGLLTACGPDGDSGGGEEKGIISKGGECVDLDFKLNKSVKYLYKAHRADKAESLFFEAQDLEFTKSTIYASARFIEIGIVTYFRSEYYVKNHYSYVSKITTTNKFENGETISTSINTYSPAPKEPYDRVCKGQAWIDEYSITTTEDNVKKETKEVYKKTVIEDINVKKTVEAGEFSTYIVTEYDKEGKLLIRGWYDIKTNKIVYAEEPSRGWTQELVEIIKN